jgi:hypothetical protein
MPRSNAQENESPLQLEQKRKIALLQQVRVLREGLMLSRGKVEAGDPGFEYHWVNTREERQNYYQAMGWELVNNDSDPTVKTKWRKPDGTHVRGDVILYRIPKETFEAMALYNVLDGQDRTGAIEDSFFAKLESSGVPGYRPRV